MYIENVEQQALHWGGDLPDGIPDVQKESLPERWVQGPRASGWRGGGSVCGGHPGFSNLYIWGYDFRPYNIGSLRKLPQHYFVVFV